MFNQPHSNLRYRMAPQFHLQAFASSAGQAHGLADQGKITVLPLPLVLDHKADYVASRMASYKISARFPLI